MGSDWRNSLPVDDKGNLTKSISNYRAIFTHDENLSQIRFDTFCQDDISFSPLFLNVNGRLLGVVFTDGKYTFSGRQLDNELKLSALTEKFGDLKQITHDNVRDWYEDYRQQLHYINDWKACKVIDSAYPEFDKVFPNSKLPSAGYTSPDSLLSYMPMDYQTDFQAEHENSKDSKTSFVGLELLCDLLLMPYAKPLSIGGGGGGNNRGWRNLDDDDKEKFRFRFNFSKFNKPQFKRKR